jgi:hypothetical protein
MVGIWGKSKDKGLEVGTSVECLGKGMKWPEPKSQGQKSEFILRETKESSNSSNMENSIV